MNALKMTEWESVMLLGPRRESWLGEELLLPLEPQKHSLLMPFFGSPRLAALASAVRVS